MLEDAGEYVQETELGALTRQAESQLAQKLLVKLGYTEEEAAAKYQNCLDFEGMLATAMYPDSVKKTPEYFAMVNNFFSLEEMKELQGNVPILESFSAMGYADQEQYMVAEPEYVKKLCREAGPRVLRLDPGIPGHDDRARPAPRSPTRSCSPTWSAPSCPGPLRSCIRRNS